MCLIPLTYSFWIVSIRFRTKELRFLPIYKRSSKSYQKANKIWLLEIILITVDGGCKIFRGSCKPDNSTHERVLQNINLRKKNERVFYCSEMHIYPNIRLVGQLLQFQTKEIRIQTKSISFKNFARIQQFLQDYDFWKTLIKSERDR